jgi:hypothetical protein
MTTRRCTRRGCETNLASFNHGTTCYLHTSPLIPKGHRATEAVRAARSASGTHHGHLTLDRLTRAERGTYRNGEWIGPSAGEAS